MSNRKQMSNARRIELVREARAGLIPESDNWENERRVRTSLTLRMIRTAKTHLGSVARVSDDLAITNILSDLRHYCDCKGLAFKKLDRAAYALYSEVKSDESGWLAPPGNLEDVTYWQPARRMRRKM